MTCRDALPVLLDGARTLGLHLDPHTQNQFVLYCDLLSDANTRINLTALRSPETMMAGLFLDSLTCILALPDDLREPGRDISVVDVGAGAGLPGLPLRLIFPNWRLTLIESIGKKARFLADLVQELALDNVTIEPERSEVAAASPRCRDRADLCLARAVAPLPSLIELCAPLVRPGGTLVFPKGKGAAAEVEAASGAAQSLHARWDATISLPPELGHLGQGRVLVRYRKTGVTPAEFPRRVGLARSHPIAPRRASPRPTRGNRSRPR